MATAKKTALKKSAAKKDAATTMMGISNDARSRFDEPEETASLSSESTAAVKSRPRRTKAKKK